MNYVKLVIRTAKQIAKYGTPLIIRRAAMGNYDPAMDTYSHPTCKVAIEINSDDTSLTIKDIEGIFLNSGIIIIDTEQIFYTSLTDLVLGGLIRGYNDTTPIAHNVDTTVTASYFFDNTYGVIEDYDAELVDGSTILYGDKKIMVPSTIMAEIVTWLLSGGIWNDGAMWDDEGFWVDIELIITPQQNDKIIQAGVVYNVVKTETIAPGGMDIYHEIQVRG